MFAIHRLINTRLINGRCLLNHKNAGIALNSIIPIRVQNASTRYAPSAYKGPDYETLKVLKEKHVVPCVRTYYKNPLLIHEGNMQWLFDQNGKPYLDLCAGIVTVSVGHCHPKVNEVVREQIEKLWHTSVIYMNPNMYEYARELTSTLPGDLKVVYFVNSGSEANDLAVLLARAYTKNYDVISFRSGYHGASPYIMGVTSLASWRFDVPLTFGNHHAMQPDVYGGLWGGKHCRDSPIQTNRNCSCDGRECLAGIKYYEQFEELFKYSLPKGNVAGFIAESIQGVSGTIQYPKGYLKKAFELVRSNGGLCISDEVQTGFGRTGDHFWGFQGHDVIPDIVTMAKGIGNGFPLAAVVTTPQVAQVLTRASHFNTFGGNPLGTAVGRVVLKIIEEEKLQDNSRKVGTYFLEKLSTLRAEFDIVGDVRGKGLMIGVELVEDKSKRSPMPIEDFDNIWEDCKDMGLLLGRGGLHRNVIRISPPMCITKEDVDFAMDIMRSAFQNHYNSKK